MIVLSVALGFLIHWNGDGLDEQFTYLIVFAVYLLIAGLLAFVGLRKFKQVKAPERTIAQVQQNKEAFRRG